MNTAVRAGTGPAGGSDVVVTPVTGRWSLGRFLRLPWRIYGRGHPHWVPPLLAEQRLLLNRDRHPFHRHADVEYFLARRGRRTVGRIAAILNRRHIEFHREPVGFFGFFEAEDDVATAAALLAAAESWLRERGMESVRGPTNFSTNETCGLLVDGFDRTPAVMMPYNPPYYATLLERLGYVKARDLLAYRLVYRGVPDRLLRAGERLRREGLRIRSLDMRAFDEEVERIREIYNSAWERNWGFVPMTDAEFDHMARQLKPVADPRLCLIAEVDDEPVGFSLALPDFNQVLRRLNGRLFPFGLAKVLWYRRKIDGIRIITLGLKPGFRRRGIDALFYLQTYTAGHEAGFRWGECSWILEDNWDMRRALERLGGRIDRTYRIFEKPL